MSTKSSRSSVSYLHEFLVGPQATEEGDPQAAEALEARGSHSAGGNVQGAVRVRDEGTDWCLPENRPHSKARLCIQTL